MSEGRNERVRRAVYAAFVSGGTVPEAPVLAKSLGITAEAAESALAALAASRDVVVDDSGRVILAHPFSSANLGFSVMGASTLWWGGCAWDSFAIPHLIPGEASVLVATTCPACSNAHAWIVNNVSPPSGAQVAHFLVPAQDIWADVVHACSDQRIFCSEACVADWLATTGVERGYVLGLETLWRLAAHWYDGRLATPYARRDPVAAADYFRSVGLRGPFWGLPDE